MKTTFLTITFLMLGLAAYAQYDPNNYDEHSPVPKVGLNDRSATLQQSLFPEYYRTNAVRTDMRWVQRNDSALTAFWTENGRYILGLLADLSGFAWHENEFDIYLVRYYTDIGEGEPVIIPIGGIRKSHLVEVAPDGCRMQLNLIFQLAKRMLAQADQPEDGVYLPIAGHPLMQAEPYRRDNLAMLLALVAGQYVMGLDSTYNAFQSAFWQEHFPGRDIFNEYLLKEWILSPEHTLIMWLADEPYNSRLVQLTRPPRRPAPTTIPANREYIKGLPLKGQLGFSVKLNTSNRLEVDQMDIERLAYACGLQVGDEIRLIDNVRPRNFKDLIEKILAGLDKNGVMLEVSREGQNLGVLIRPMTLFSPEDEDYYWEDYETPRNAPDSILIDTLLIPDSVPPENPEN
ncbi:MAG: hypothetical protein ACOYVF_14795 [Candidatus Zixiibacteriota bacterium]